MCRLQVDSRDPSRLCRSMTVVLALHNWPLRSGSCWAPLAGHCAWPVLWQSPTRSKYVLSVPSLVAVLRTGNKVN